MLEKLRKILKLVVIHWFRLLPTPAGLTTGVWLLWFYRAHLKGWLFNSCYIEMRGWVWVLICVVELLLVVYFIWAVVKKFGQLKVPRGIFKTIEYRFTNGDEFGDVPQTNTPYFFEGAEKSLNLKRTVSRMYLPSVSFKHGYAFQTCKKHSL